MMSRRQFWIQDFGASPGRSVAALDHPSESRSSSASDEVFWRQEGRSSMMQDVARLVAGNWV